MNEDPLAWETLDRSVAYRCDGFDVVNERVRFPDGDEGEFDYLSEPPSVGVLAFDADGDVVLIEEWRQAVDRVNRGIPVGTVEPEDADLTAAARRELAEETGYVADSMDPLVTVEPANGIADAVLHFFVARGCAPASEQDLDRDESIRVRTDTFERLRSEVLAGEIRDGRTVLAVSYYLLARE